MANKKPTKKQKIIYYDDNSTVSDMSNIKAKKHKSAFNATKKQSTFKEKWATYWSAVKMMFIPMCVALAIIAGLFLLFTILR